MRQLADRGGKWALLIRAASHSARRPPPRARVRDATRVLIEYPLEAISAHPMGRPLDSFGGGRAKWDGWRAKWPSARPPTSAESRETPKRERRRSRQLTLICTRRQCKLRARMQMRPDCSLDTSAAPSGCVTVANQQAPLSWTLGRAPGRDGSCVRLLPARFAISIVLGLVVSQRKLGPNCSKNMIRFHGIQLTNRHIAMQASCFNLQCKHKYKHTHTHTLGNCFSSSFSL